MLDCKMKVSLESYCLTPDKDLRSFQRSASFIAHFPTAVSRACDLKIHRALTVVQDKRSSALHESDLIPTKTRIHTAATSKVVPSQQRSRRGSGNIGQRLCCHLEASTTPRQSPEIRLVVEFAGLDAVRMIRLSRGKQTGRH